MKRMSIVFAVAIGLVAVPALAGEPAADREKSRIESTEKARPETRRPTSVERWRGRPYVRGSNELVRNEALDKALPPVNSVFQGGALGGF